MSHDQWHLCLRIRCLKKKKKGKKITNLCHGPRVRTGKWSLGRYQQQVAGKKSCGASIIATGKHGRQIEQRRISDEGPGMFGGTKSHEATGTAGRRSGSVRAGTETCRAWASAACDLTRAHRRMYRRQRRLCLCLCCDFFSVSFVCACVVFYMEHARRYPSASMDLIFVMMVRVWRGGRQARRVLTGRKRPSTRSCCRFLLPRVTPFPCHLVHFTPYASFSS